MLLDRMERVRIMLHDKFDLDIEYAIRLLIYTSRDNDDSGAEMFWDLAGKMATELQYYKHEEKQEIIYNVLHKVRGATLEEAAKHGAHQHNTGA